MAGERGENDGQISKAKLQVRDAIYRCCKGNQHNLLIGIFKILVQGGWKGSDLRLGMRRLGSHTDSAAELHQGTNSGAWEGGEPKDQLPWSPLLGWRIIFLSSISHFSLSLIFYTI